MGKIILSVSMSLDGFIAGSNYTKKEPMGENGERLHDWMFKGSGEATIDRAASNIPGRERYKMEQANAEVLQDVFAASGAFLMGRRWFDHGEHVWGNDTFPAPVFVVTHRNRQTLQKGKTSYTFVTDGLESAVKQAKAAAGDKHVTTGGADIPRQLIKAGLLDEILISLVPVLLGRGVKLFDDSLRLFTELERISVVEGEGVTHMRYNVIK